MQRIFYLILLTFISTSVICAQENEMQKQKEKKGIEYSAGDIFLGLSSGINYDINAYKTSTDENGFTFDKRNPHFNIGGYLGIMVTKKFRPRFEMRYVRTSFEQAWDQKEYPTFINTTVKLDNLDLNLHFDYLVLNSNKWHVFLSPALKSEFMVGEDYKTTKTDDDDSNDKFKILEERYPKSIAGAALSAIFKYDINKKVGLTFTPDYTMFFRSYQKDNSESYYRFSFNIGLEFRFH